jgi:hypothetical protein
MPDTPIQLQAGDGAALSCRTVILVPDIALSEAGHIKMLSVNTGPQTKHEFHALAQTALIRFQDKELTVTSVSGPLCVKAAEETECVDAGMAIARDTDGQLYVWAHPGTSNRKRLQAADRFCTRWIRMDL